MGALSEGLFELPVVWRISAAWVRRAHDCTLAGIQARCGGACCHGPTYWPAISSEAGRAGGPCARLGPEGCTWEPVDRPVTCLLYPLRLNRAGMLVLHHRTTTATSVCRGNHGQGPRLIDAMRVHLEALFGPEQYAQVLEAVNAGRDGWVQPSQEVLDSYLLELAQEQVLEPPIARRQQRAPLPMLR